MQRCSTTIIRCTKVSPMSHRDRRVFLIPRTISISEHSSWILITLRCSRQINSTTTIINFWPAIRSYPGAVTRTNNSWLRLRIRILRSFYNSLVGSTGGEGRGGRRVYGEKRGERGFNWEQDSECVCVCRHGKEKSHVWKRGRERCSEGSLYHLIYLC